MCVANLKANAQGGGKGDWERLTKQHICLAQGHRQYMVKALGGGGGKGVTPHGRI